MFLGLDLGAVELNEDIFEQEKALVSVFLQRCGRIRLIVNDLYGYGDYQNIIRIMLGLAEHYGVSDFQIMQKQEEDDDEEGAGVEQKYTNLIPESERSNWQYSGDGHILKTEFSFFRRNKRINLQIVIFRDEDAVPDVGQVYGKALLGFVGVLEENDNPKELYAVENLIALQPYSYVPAHNFFILSDDRRFDFSSIRELETIPASAYYIRYELSELEFRRELKKIESRCNLSGALYKFVSGSQNGSFLSCVVYFSKSLFADSEDGYIDVSQAFIRACLKFQEGRAKSDVVVLSPASSLFSDDLMRRVYGVRSKSCFIVLSDENVYPRSRAGGDSSELFTKSCYRNKTVGVYYPERDCDRNGLEHYLRLLRQSAGERPVILIIKTGFLSPILFDFLLSRSNFFNAGEGANIMETAVNMDVPFLRIRPFVVAELDNNPLELANYCPVLWTEPGIISETKQVADCIRLANKSIFLSLDNAEGWASVGAGPLAAFMGRIEFFRRFFRQTKAFHHDPRNCKLHRVMGHLVENYTNFAITTTDAIEILVKTIRLTITIQSAALFVEDVRNYFASGILNEELTTFLRNKKMLGAVRMIYRTSSSNLRGKFLSTLYFVRYMDCYYECLNLATYIQIGRWLVADLGRFGEEPLRSVGEDGAYNLIANWMTREYPVLEDRKFALQVLDFVRRCFYDSDEGERSLLWKLIEPIPKKILNDTGWELRRIILLFKESSRLAFIRDLEVFFSQGVVNTNLTHIFADHKDVEMRIVDIYEHFERKIILLGILHQVAQEFMDEENEEEGETVREY